MEKSSYCSYKANTLQMIVARYTSSKLEFKPSAGDVIIKKPEEWI